MKYIFAVALLAMIACTPTGGVDTTRLPQPPEVLTVDPASLDNTKLCQNIKDLTAWKDSWVRVVAPWATLAGYDVKEVDAKLEKALKVADARKLACGVE